MCGRYHMDEEMTEEIRRMVKILESRLNTGSRDIYPSMEAPVILKNEGGGLKAASMAWGFPGRDKKQLLINARSETALERPSFSRAVSHRRCVLPARWFYEWNPSVRPVHHRMPLILEKEELEEWIWENCSMEKFLKKTPGLLECRQEYRQERLFFL